MTTAMNSDGPDEPARPTDYVEAERRLVDAISADIPGTQAGDGQRGVVARVRGRAEALIGRVLANRRVVTVQAVLDANGGAGGPLLAAGLAFNALFAILPGLLLLAGLSGLWIQDPVRRAELLRDLVARVPPLEAPLRATLDQLADKTGAFSIIGLAGLAWGASNIYGALD